MDNTSLVWKLIHNLWQHILPYRRLQFGWILVLMVLTSFAEVLSIGAVLPFLGALTSPEKIYGLSVAQPFIHLFNITRPNQILLPLTVVFGFSSLIAGAMRLYMLWSSVKLSFGAGADLSIKIYRHTLYQPYSVHCGRNTSEVINGISGQVNVVIFNIFMSTMTLLSSLVIIFSVLIAMIFVSPLITISLFICLGIIYIVLIVMTKKRLLTHSQIIARESTQVIKILQEGLGGIRDVLIDGAQETYCGVYQNADKSLRRAQGSSIFIAASPRFGMEALGMMLISALAYVLARDNNGVAGAIPILGAMALGAQRLLPVLQQAYGAWAQITGGEASLKDILNLLNQPLPLFVQNSVNFPLVFNKNLILDNVCFSYNKKKPLIIKNLNLTVAKGARIGFIGTTGSGKSTLLDIVMGLLMPTSGSVTVDGVHVTPKNIRSWQSQIAHVPQGIFLTDNTIEENIAFGVPKNFIDHGRVVYAAKKAQIADDIESWPSKYNTYVGERGVRLSGGQRQRIGIARALYKNANVIVFDEATSALDNDTEQAVIEAIEQLSTDLTIFIIAHRLTTLKKCTLIVELGEGSIKRTGTYKEIIGSYENQL